MWELTSLQFFSLLSVKIIRKCTLAGDDRGKKQRKTTQPCLIKTGWCVRFAWLIHDSKSHIFRCKVCMHAKAKNVFVTGKDDLAKQEISADHQRSTLLLKRHMDCERSREVSDYRPYADYVDASEAVFPDS